jgi:Tol biopolymer transport system component
MGARTSARKNVRQEVQVMRWVLGRITLGIAVTCGVALGQVTIRASVDSNGTEAAQGSYYAVISANGRVVAFASGSTDLVATDVNGMQDVFVRDVQAGTTELVSVDSNGLQGNGNSWLFGSALSGDGRYVAFDSEASNLVPGDTNGVVDVFVRDRLTGTTERVSVDAAGLEADGESRWPAISEDGRYVAFESAATNLVIGDSNGTDDVFVHDRQSGMTELVSVNSSGVQGNGPSVRPTVSADGRYVAFRSYASNLISTDTNSIADVFVRDRQQGTTVRVSQEYSAGVQYVSADFSISADGRFVVFSRQDNTGQRWDIFLHDAQSGTIEQVSFGADHNFSGGPAISADGRFVAFHSTAPDLVLGDTNGAVDVFLVDRLLGAVQRLSVHTDGTQGDMDSFLPAISADGRYVAFTSRATSLVTADTNDAGDTFVRDRQPTAVSFCFGDGTGGPCPCGNTGNAFHGCANSAFGFTGGAVLIGSGFTKLSNDTFRMTSFGESYPYPAIHSLSLFLQGDAAIPPQNFGDGLRCAGGTLKRLYVWDAPGGTATAPQASDPPVSVRSASLGDTITSGSMRYYQVQYRDRADWFCPNPPGNTWNVTNALSVLWGP